MPTVKVQNEVTLKHNIICGHRKLHGTEMLQGKQYVAPSLSKQMQYVENTGSYNFPFFGQEIF